MEATLKSQVNSGLVLDERGIVIFYPFALTLKKATKSEILNFMLNVSKNLIKESEIMIPRKDFIALSESEISKKYSWGKWDVNMWFVREDDMENMICTVSTYVLPIRMTGSPSNFEQSDMRIHTKLINRNSPETYACKETRRGIMFSRSSISIFD